MSLATTKAIKVLQNSFPSDRLAFPQTEPYNQRLTSYLSLLESEIRPGIIFLPQNKEEVSSFIKLIKPLVSQHDVKFAIRGAGQQPLPGCANIEHGITLDLSALTDIEVHDGVVCIGAGCRWAAVYDRLQEEGLAVTGARSGNNGVGGLALAGKN
jgi:FAD/FMN-containing dehydrogenase